MDGHTVLKHHCKKKLSDGRPDSPLGAVNYSNGVNFSVYSRYARQVYVLLFDDKNGQATAVIKLIRDDQYIWSRFVHDIGPGQLYGIKVKGKYDPVHGFRFNEHKLLLDPYARAIVGQFHNRDGRNVHYGYDLDAEQKDLVPDLRDNTAEAPKCLVVDNTFDWQGVESPGIPKEKLIVYETHVKGFNAHPSSGRERKGYYLDFIAKIPYLKELGINAVELLPVHEKYVRDDLINAGLTDYWGYNTIGFFAPEQTYSSGSHPGCQVDEFKTMVRELHRAGLEVILDVVYNHTGEGNQLGPTLCFRGIDNPTYYALMGTQEEPYRYYRNDTGTGNLVNAENKAVVRFIVDSLRYWVEVMHVDGFRFDLAAAIFKLNGEYSLEALLFEAMAQDPVLKRAKWIAEPWDLTTYQNGHFPQGWSEWNGQFRDRCRSFLKGDPGQVRHIAWRLAGSSDMFAHNNRYPFDSINFITCHDGFTLHDLYAYNVKHNKPNQEDNRDGADHNLSWNCGVEGPTRDQSVLALRNKMIKNALTCLFVSLGTPMLLYGDECGRTQQGNNNTYCQDNELSWMDWGLIDKNRELFDFCKKLIAMRKQYTVLQRPTFMQGEDKDSDQVPDIAWYNPFLETPEWEDEHNKFIAYQLDGSEVPSELGDYHLFILLNAHFEAQTSRLTQHEGQRWYRILDTSYKQGEDFMDQQEELDPQDSYLVSPYSIAILISR
jgi:glycogen operon protein